MLKQQYIAKAENLDMVTKTAFEYIIHNEKSLRELKLLAVGKPLNTYKLERWFSKKNPFALLDIDNVSSYLFQELIMADLDFNALAKLLNEVIEIEKAIFHKSKLN